MTNKLFFFFYPDKDEDLVKKASPKIKENGTSPGIRLETTGTPKADTSSKKNEKHFSPVKLVPTSVADYFGTGNVKRSEKKLVSSKRKEVSIQEIILCLFSACLEG